MPAASGGPCPDVDEVSRASAAEAHLRPPRTPLGRDPRAARSDARKPDEDGRTRQEDVVIMVMTATISAATEVTAEMADSQ